MDDADAADDTDAPNDADAADDTDAPNDADAADDTDAADDGSGDRADAGNGGSRNGGSGDDGPGDDGSGDGDHATGDKPIRLADAADLDALVAEHDVVLVEFFTAGCGICASMEPVLGNVARATDATVALVNPRDDPPLIERFAITSVPTLVLFEDGEPVGRVARGFVGTADLVAFVESRGRSGVGGDGTGGTPLGS